MSDMQREASHCCSSFHHAFGQSERRMWFAHVLADTDGHKLPETAWNESASSIECWLEQHRKASSLNAAVFWMNRCVWEEHHRRERSREAYMCGMCRSSSAGHSRSHMRSSAFFQTQRAMKEALKHVGIYTGGREWRKCACSEGELLGESDRGYLAMLWRVLVPAAVPSMRKSAFIGPQWFGVLIPIIVVIAAARPSRVEMSVLLRREWWPSRLRPISLQDKMCTCRP